MAAIGMARSPASYLTNDIVRCNDAANTYGIKNISTTDTQVAVLRDCFSENYFCSDTQAAFPFIDSDDFAEIIKLRDQEWHHFNEFRATVGEAAESGEDVSKLLREETNKIGLTVNRAARRQNSVLFNEGAVLAMHAGITVMSAGISTAIATVGAALGGRHFTAKIVPILREKLRDPEEARTSKLYYAWRLEKLRL